MNSFVNDMLKLLFYNNIQTHMVLYLLFYSNRIDRILVKILWTKKKDTKKKFK